MKPRSQGPDERQLFLAHFDQILNPAHPLLRLAKQIDWKAFDEAFGNLYCEAQGAPAKATRLMVGLNDLKHTFNESDESVLDRWIENPYWQAFCGYTHMQHQPPIHPTSMSRWRKRVGPDKLVELLKQTVRVAVQQKHLPIREIRQVNIDTTVQEKNITHPTDSKLLYKAIVQLGAAAQKSQIVLRQSYRRVAKRAAAKAGRYAHAKQFRRMRRELRRLRTWAGRLIRDIKRKTPCPGAGLVGLLDRCQRLVDQQPKDSHKLYSLHEPEVCCISKGKAHKRYEFGQKIAVATTHRRDWFVGALLCPGNPYDGHTLRETLQHVQHVTGVEPTDAYLDRGYRGHGDQGEVTIHLAGRGSKRLTRTQRQRRRRRSAIEPKIGHAKQGHRMGRCFLKGLDGDATNAVLATAGANLAKLIRLASRAWPIPHPDLSAGLAIG